MSQDITARHLLIQGRVQGVRFRASMVDKARELGVAGWVRNRADGQVEALLQGPADTVHILTEWAQHGPSRARVSKVEITEIEAEALTGFRQRKSI